MSLPSHYHSDSSPLAPGLPRPLPAHGFPIPQRQPVVQHVPRPARELAWGRFRPYVGGEDAKELFIAPGAVAYCREAEENTEDSEQLEGIRVTPIYPRIDGVAINAEEPRSFDIAGKSGASVWLKVDRTRCPGNTLVPTEDSTETEELVLLAKGEKPPKAKSELHLLLCEMEFETASDGSQSIKKLDQRWASDVEVWFKCEEDKSESFLESSNELGSSDFDSSDLSDMSEPSSQSSTNCPIRMDARWSNRRSCYNRGERYCIVWECWVGLGGLYAKCKNWTATLKMSGGHAAPYRGQSGMGDSVIVPLRGKKSHFGARFCFPNGVPSCENGTFTMTVTGTPDPLDDPAEPCCKTFTLSRQYRWKAWCHYQCNTTVVPPP